MGSQQQTRQTTWKPSPRAHSGAPLLMATLIAKHLRASTNKLTYSTRTGTGLSTGMRPTSSPNYGRPRGIRPTSSRDTWAASSRWQPSSSSSSPELPLEPRLSLLPPTRRPLSPLRAPLCPRMARVSSQLSRRARMSMLSRPPMSLSASTRSSMRRLRRRFSPEKRLSSTLRQGTHEVKVFDGQGAYITEDRTCYNVDDPDKIFCLEKADCATEAHRKLWESRGLHAQSFEHKHSGYGSFSQICTGGSTNNCNLSGAGGCGNNCYGCGTYGCNFQYGFCHCVCHASVPDYATHAECSAAH